MLTHKAISDILSDDAFWAAIATILESRMKRMNARALLLGMEAAADEGVVFDADTLFAEGLRRAGQAGAVWARQMTDTTREALRQALASWPSEDATPLVMEALGPMFDEARAERVAATETTRLFNDGGALAMLWDDMIQGQRWEASVDERTCPICSERHGNIYPKGQGPAIPSHPSCRCVYRPANWRYISVHPRQWQGRPIAFEVRLGQ